VATGPLRSGEPCLFIDGKGRRYLAQLREGAELRSHLGTVPHASVIGLPEGARLTSSAGKEFVVIRPGLADYILKMKRGPQVVYPKDLGAILIEADIAPGSVVVEGGTGSGALAMTLLRAVGPGGRVVSVDRRADHLELARRSVKGFFGELPPNLELREGMVEDAVREESPDRVVLDVPEPWHVVDPAQGGLQGGGVFCAYVPTVLQLAEIVETLRESGGFAEIRTVEVLVRTWHVEGRSVRPDHRMVGHTGFITVARKLTPERV